MKKMLISAVLFAGVFSAGSALAESANLNIEAKVVNSCSVKFEAPTIHFNIAKDSFSGAEQASYFTAQCGNTGLKVALDSGLSLNSGVRAMKLQEGVGTIPYIVYQGASGTTEWNDKDGIYKVSSMDSLSGKQQPFRVVIPDAGVTGKTPNGDYLDKLVATISYEAAS